MVFTQNFDYTEAKTVINFRIPSSKVLMDDVCIEVTKCEKFNGFLLALKKITFNYL